MHHFVVVTDFFLLLVDLAIIIIVVLIVIIGIRQTFSIRFFFGVIFGRRWNINYIIEVHFHDFWFILQLNWLILIDYLFSLARKKKTHLYIYIYYILYIAQVYGDILVVIDEKEEKEKNSHLITFFLIYLKTFMNRNYNKK